jgi:hypothetical protein
VRSIIQNIRDLYNYLMGKTSEIQDLDMKDVLLTKVILDIHRKRIRKEFISVPLFALKPIHAIDRENSLAATEMRAETLRAHREEMVARRIMDREVLGEYLPSVSWIKVVREADDSFIAYEGNGRVYAMQWVFTPQDGIMVEVEEYVFNNPSKIVKRMNKVREVNGLS